MNEKIKKLKHLFFSPKNSDTKPTIDTQPLLNEQGLVFVRPTTQALEPVAARLAASTWAYLEQLEDEGFLVAMQQADSTNQAVARYLLPWANLYELLNDDEHASSLELLQIPQFTPLKPILTCQGSLSDADFAIVIQGWRAPNGSIQTELPLIGAVTEQGKERQLLPQNHWQLIQAVGEFYRQPKRNEASNQASWAHIRKIATAAQAEMDDFLTKTIVLSPDKLKLNLRKSQLTNTPVIEVEPHFKDQPQHWLREFDRYPSVQDRYVIQETDGTLTHVLMTPEVKSVLEPIKKMPLRRVSGDSALAFIKNPFPMLGDDAVSILDAETYESGLEEAGITFHRFDLQPQFNEQGRITQIDLRLSPLSGHNPQDVTLIFSQPAEFARFVDELAAKIKKQLPCGFWQGYELELGDFNAVQLKGLAALCERWQQEYQALDMVSSETEFDLAHYGERVIGIGLAPKISSPYLNNGPAHEWLSPELLNQLGADGDVLSKWDNSKPEDCEAFERRIEEAQKNNSPSVLLPVLELPLPIESAVALSKEWRKKFQSSPESSGQEESVPKSSVLLIESNIETLGYEAACRADLLRPAHNAATQLPFALRPSTILRDHQLKGVAWLQYLFKQSPNHISGCLLADDMGLGKTLQLLTFIANYFETELNAEPVLIVAPVSLLDNWENELKNFFDASNLSTLKLYGSTLAAAKLGRHEASESDRQLGIKHRLKPNWRGQAKIVLATYETLRDQQFSMATLNWGMMICDEAQKIKNPAALVTQAVKAISARFKVACTGTPVENSLTDLWCLFDFIQPGLLGTLNQFGKQYRRPVETKTTQEQQALELLRSLIEPQLLRRTKTEVAKDLPEKIENMACRSLPIAPEQRRLYQTEIQHYEQQRKLLEDVKGSNTIILTLLAKLRKICAHPALLTPAFHVISSNPLEQSPKMNWLIETLDKIKQKNEKVIIFSELRDVQRALKLAIQTHYQFNPIIINGDTKAISTKKDGESRQRLIDEFQAQTGFGVIILSTTAVGFGVNVQAANHVIHFTRTWNPAKEDQATDRAYRIGQTRPVHVYYPTVTAPDFSTFEATLDLLLSKKRALAGDILNGSGEVSLPEIMQEIAH